jgi:predicted transcriptional regulator
MSATIELDEQRRSSLAKLARRRKLPLRSVLEQAVDDEFINRAEDEDLLQSSARTARQTGLREADAVEIVRRWRRKHPAKRRG